MTEFLMIAIVDYGAGKADAVLVASIFHRGIYSITNPFKEW
jgi:imidazole glycerol phosphate synthase subunit HisF